MLDTYFRNDIDDDNETPDLRALTGREIETLFALATNASVSHAAQVLDMSVAEVKVAQAAIYRKLCISSREELRRFVSGLEHELETTTARELHKQVLPALVGAKIVGCFLHHDYWCGFIMRMPNGDARRVWLMDENGVDGGSIHVGPAFGPDQPQGDPEPRPGPRPSNQPAYLFAEFAEEGADAGF